MNEHPPRRTARRIRAVRHAMTATAAAGLALTALVPTSASASASASAAPAAAPRPDVVQQRLDALVKADGMPAALATVDTYLPGLLRGDGVDGRNITVRQLLQHTSGLPDYMLAPALLDFTTIQYRYFEPRELLDGALAQRAVFAPGTGWGYSNTNYLVAGLLIQKVTGRPYAEEVTRRVIDRIGLRHTYLPATGETALREPHPHGYLNTGDTGEPASGARLVDYTEMDSSMAWAAGAVVSTNSDLNAFYGALLGGRLLPAAQLAQMRSTVPAELLGPGVRYGLGIQSRPLSCGGLVWGHGGTAPGHRSRGGVTEDGRAANITVTTVPEPPAAEHVTDAVDAALCR
ncbi:serine hydrolase domain-containing protein [Kitasatospora setae]|uniref:serine hydrolase domain-containing protein n=1 Tax=Kitasatospora setae TaxID=2066 RepID=UPI000525199E|nr:serine hydrolase domain-containing protein [Kitasatospora setae]